MDGRDGHWYGSFHSCWMTMVSFSKPEGQFGVHDRISIGYDKKLDNDMIG